MGSIWERGVAMPSFPTLDGDVHTDILVVGGGIAGLWCAYLLQKAGADYLLVEADTLCGGVTGNTTAKITAQHGPVYHKLLSAWGEEKTRLFWEANQRAVERYQWMAENIPCDFALEKNVVFSRGDRDILEEEQKALASIGVEAAFTQKTPLPFPVAGALEVGHQARFHPLKFLSVLAQGLNIREHSRVEEFAPGVAVTAQGRIFANKIIIATHFPILNKHGGYFVKMHQSRSYVLALEGVDRFPGMYVEETENGLSFRWQDGLLLLGGGRHRTGKSGGGWDYLRRLAKGWYPQAKEVAHWATQDCMTLDGGPYAGRYSPKTPDLFVLTGFNKWGMTTSLAGAEVVTDLAQGRANLYAPAFAPDRPMAPMALTGNALSAVWNLIRPTTPRCPHLGCALRYNQAEHTWDCPCHGSRFDEKGRLLDGPATGDLKNPPDPKEPQSIIPPKQEEQ